MSYHTKFVGRFNLDKPLTLGQFNILNDFSEADHRHQQGAPGAWCDWVPAKDGESIEWNGRSGSFYDYVEWLEFLIIGFLRPWGYTLNGRVDWQGEEVGDHGTILVIANEVSTEDSATLEKVAEWQSSNGKVISLHFNAARKEIYWKIDGEFAGAGKVSSLRRPNAQELANNADLHAVVDGSSRLGLTKERYTDLRSQMEIK